MVAAICAEGEELIVGGISGQAVDAERNSRRGVEVVEGGGVEPACGGAGAACGLELCRRKHPAGGLVQIDFAVGHLGQEDEAVLQAEQLFVAGGAVEFVAVTARVHADGHVVVAVEGGDIHGEDGLSGVEVQHDVLPHAAVHVLHEAVDIAGGGGELHHGGVAEVVAAPDALHGPAVGGADGVHPFDAGHDHAVALEQPVAVVDVLVALDGRVTVGLCKVGAACAEPVADDGADPAIAVVVDDGRIFHRHRHVGGQLVDDGMAGRHLAGADVHSHQADGLEVVGKEDQLFAQRGRAAAAPCQTAAGGGSAFAAVFCAHAVVGGAPDDFNAAVGAQQVAGKIRQDDRTLPAGGNAVFSTFARSGSVDMDFVVEVGGAAGKDGFDGIVGDVAHRALLAAAGVDAEAAGDEPEVAVVVEDDGEQILLEAAAKHPLGSLFDVDVQYLFKNRQRRTLLVGGAKHQHMVVAGGADDEVAPVHKGIGALDEIATAVVPGGREKADGADFFCVEVADGQTAQERADGVIEVVEEDGRGGVGVRLFHCHVDLGADAHGEDGVGGVGVVAVVVDV